MTLSDPNKDRNDPMVPEYWALGEEIQDKVRLAGYDSPQVEGIAVDIHDLLQAADRIRSELGPAVLSADRSTLAEVLGELAAEIEHIRWHCESAVPYLRAAAEQLNQRSACPCPIPTMFG